MTMCHGVNNIKAKHVTLIAQWAGRDGRLLLSDSSIIGEEQYHLKVD